MVLWMPLFLLFNLHVIYYSNIFDRELRSKVLTDMAYLLVICYVFLWAFVALNGLKWPFNGLLSILLDLYRLFLRSWIQIYLVARYEWSAIFWSSIAIFFSRSRSRSAIAIWYLVKRSPDDRDRKIQRSRSQKRDLFGDLWINQNRYQFSKKNIIK